MLHPSMMNTTRLFLSHARRVTARRHSTAIKSKSPKTPLVDSLSRRIRVAGPLSIAEYMRECLTHPQHGYYMKKDVFGTKGDFITSPEISQMFGELLAVWVAAEWQTLNSTDNLHLIEYGPGRGTLAADMLRTLSQFKFLEGKLSLHLIEVSPKMKAMQCAKLCESDLDLSEVEDPRSRTSVYGDIPVSWHRSLGDIAMKGQCCIVAHEFLDALPIHKFHKNADDVFHEVLIDVAEDKDPHHFREVLSPTPNANCKMFIHPKDERDHVEVSPMSGVIVQEISQCINKHGGFALLADYGHDGSKEDTFRAFKDHKLHHPLESPGEADLTADVDFSFLRYCAAPLNVVLHGPITQQAFLHNMGISVRLQSLLSQTKDEQRRKDLLTSYKMLCSPDEMGDRFKFFSLHQSGVNHSPAGFADLS